jgi:hypothetical protein
MPEFFIFGKTFRRGFSNPRLEFGHFSPGVAANPKGI